MASCICTTRERIPSGNFQSARACAIFFRPSDDFARHALYGVSRFFPSLTQNSPRTPHMEDLRESILESEAQTGERDIEARRHFNRRLKQKRRSHYVPIVLVIEGSDLRGEYQLKISEYRGNQIIKCVPIHDGQTSFSLIPEGECNWKWARFKEGDRRELNFVSISAEQLNKVPLPRMIESIKKVFDDFSKAYSLMIDTTTTFRLKHVRPRPQRRTRRSRSRSRYPHNDED